MWQGHMLLWEAPTVEHIGTFLFQVGKAALPGEEEDWFVMRPCPRYNNDAWLPWTLEGAGSTTARLSTPYLKPGLLGQWILLELWCPCQIPVPAQSYHKRPPVFCFSVCYRRREGGGPQCPRGVAYSLSLAAVNRWWHLVRDRENINMSSEGKSVERIKWQMLILIPVTKSSGDPDRKTLLCIKGLVVHGTTNLSVPRPVLCWVGGAALGPVWCLTGWPQDERGQLTVTEERAGSSQGLC